MHPVIKCFTAIFLLMGITAGLCRAQHPQWVLSGNMSPEDIRLAINAYPPNFSHADQRLLIMESLDKILNFSVADCAFSMDPGLKERMKDIVKLYRERVDEGLDILERTPVTEGVLVVKFYSSSVVLKGRNGIVAVDFAQGPVGNDYKQGSVSNEGEPESSDFFGTGFYLTVEQRDRLASLVDVYLITHPHQDHADYSLAKRMIQAGKPVIGPEQLKLKWEDLSTGIMVPGYETTQDLRACKIYTQSGYQYSESKEVDGLRFAFPVKYLSRDVESIRYLINVDGMVFLHGAETHTEGYDWLTEAAAKGWKADVLLRAGALQGARSVMKYFADIQVYYFTLPIHEYEITHPGGGMRMAHLLKGENRLQHNLKKNMPLFWGESFLLTGKLIR